MIYEHTQSRPQLAILLAGAAGAALLAAAVLGEVALVVMGVVLLFTAAIGFALSSLTTTVTDETVTASFRFGWPRREIPRDRLLAADVVRNQWWYGVGIRIIPDGWMYNVWGLDAVELFVDGTSNFRIGTDDPHGLAAALSPHR